MRQSYWYFPGDGPVFDLLVDLGLVCFAVSILLFLVAFAVPVRWRYGVRWWSGIMVFVGLLVASPGLVIVGHRHTRAWEPARSAIRHYDQVIGETVREEGLDLPLPRADFLRLKEQYLPEGRTVFLRGWERPVRVEMMYGLPPYVGLDFGGGANAVFEPTTMVCIYSD